MFSQHDMTVVETPTQLFFFSEVGGPNHSYVNTSDYWTNIQQVARNSPSVQWDALCVCGRCRRTKLFSRKKVNKLVVEDIFCPLVVRNQFETKCGTSQTLKTCQLPAEQGMGNLALYSLLLLHNPPLLGKRFLLCTENILLCMMFICYAPNLLFKH